MILSPASNVLEHVHHINHLLRALQKMICQNEVIILALPNYSYDANYYQEYWAGYDVPRHLHHFTQEYIRSDEKTRPESCEYSSTKV